MPPRRHKLPIFHTFIHIQKYFIFVFVIIPGVSADFSRKGLIFDKIAKLYLIFYPFAIFSPKHSHCGSKNGNVPAQRAAPTPVQWGNAATVHRPKPAPAADMGNYFQSTFFYCNIFTLTFPRGKFIMTLTLAYLPHRRQKRRGGSV